MTVFGYLTVAAVIAPTVSAPAQAGLQEISPETAGVPTFPTAATPLRPAEVVASRVRDVLNDHANDAAWQELAGALPDLALAGGADIESTFEAARIAGEMVTAPPSVPAPATSAGDDPVRGALQWLGSIDADLLGQLLAIAFGLFALSMLFKGSGSRSRSLRVEPTAIRCREARALAAGGVPAYEISRRTGLARDAVSVLLSRRAR